MNKKTSIQSTRLQWIFGLTALGAILFGAYTSERLKSSVAHNQLIQQDLDNCKARDYRNAILQKQVALLRDRDTRPVPLTNGKTTCFLYYNTFRKEIALDILTMPMPDAGKYLQLWATVNKAPISMGMIDVRAIGSWQIMDYKEGVSQFMVTQEENPKGGDRPKVVVLESGVFNVETGN